MNISPDQVRHIARLARIEIGEAEVESLGSQLGNILGYIEKLDELDTSGVEPTSHVLELSNVTRADVVRPSLTPDEALANAPDRSGDFYRVPKIIE